MRQHIVRDENRLEAIDEARLPDAGIALNDRPRVRASDNLVAEELKVSITADEESNRPCGSLIPAGFEGLLEVRVVSQPVRCPRAPDGEIGHSVLTPCHLERVGHIRTGARL